MVVNRPWMALLTPQERVVIEANIEHFPVKGAPDSSIMSWWQIAETPETLEINEQVKTRIPKE